MLGAGVLGVDDPESDDDPPEESDDGGFSALTVEVFLPPSRLSVR